MLPLTNTGTVIAIAMNPFSRAVIEKYLNHTLFECKDNLALASVKSAQWYLTPLSHYITVIIPRLDRGQATLIG